MKAKFLRASLLCAVLLGLSVPVTQAQTIAIQAGRLVDPATGTASGDQVILVEDGLIQAVGAGLAIASSISSSSVAYENGGYRLRKSATRYAMLEDFIFGEFPA